jgi:hypothetical protein
MHVERNRLSRVGLATLVLALLAGPGAALAEACFPHCDYAHYYGPLDFSYKQPDLFGYPQHCGPQGNCTPYLAYTTGVPNRRLPAVPAPRVMTARPPQS